MKKATARLSIVSLRDLCVLCVSAVNLTPGVPYRRDAEHAEATQRIAYHRALRVVFALLLLPLAFCLPVLAQGWATSPPPLSSEDPSGNKVRLLENVGIDQRLGEQLPLDLVFRDENGSTVRLGDYFGKKPVVLTLVYYTCPMLCNQVLNGLTSGLDVVSFDIGKEFEVVTVSFDPRETPELARKKKQTYIDWYKRQGAAEGWHFLTGDQLSIERLTQAVGFHYKFDQSTDQFIHASGIMIATSQGKLARYFYGIEYAPKDLRLGLVEASDNKIGNPVDRLLLYCYHYDPASGKYGAVVMNILRLAGLATIVGVAAMLWLLKRRRPHPERISVGGTI
jgi:protein SCO1/2